MTMTEGFDFNNEDIDVMLANLDSFSEEEVAEIDRMVDELSTRSKNQRAYDDLIEFCKLMMPEFIVGKHHRILADLLMDIEKGDKDRICVNIPPRHGKSQLVSIFFPAWFLGRNPDKKVMMVSHTTDLAVDFGRKVRNLIALDDYRSIFPTVKLAQDSKSAGRWNTNVGGEYYACGIGSALAGRGADLLLVDDPHSEQDVINGNFSVFDNYIHEPCYLMGMIAGAMTKTNKLGMVGGYPIGEVNRLFHAFIDGAKSVNPDIQYKVTFIGSWYDPPKAKEAAFAQIEAGADIMYAERAGVVDAAREKGVLAFGNVNDMNKEENGTDVVVTSALWHMEAAIANAIAEVKSGTFKAADYKEWTMMRKGGASLAPYYEFEDRIPADIKAQVEATKAKILAGEMDVTITDTEPKSSF